MKRATIHIGDVLVHKTHRRRFKVYNIGVESREGKHRIIFVMIRLDSNTEHFWNSERVIESLDNGDLVLE